MEASEASHSHRFCLLAACLLSLVFFVGTLIEVRNFAFIPPDAAHYGVVARNLLRGHGYRESFIPFHPTRYASVEHVPELHGLLRPILILPVLALAGTTPFALYVPGIACVALLGVVVFCWGRRAFGCTAGLVACALTVTNTNLLFFGLLGADDVSYALFFTMAAALLHRGLVEGRDRFFLLAGALSGLALLEKLAGIAIVVLFAAPLIQLRYRGPRRVAQWVSLLLMPFAVAMGIYMTRNYAAYGSVQFRFGVFNWIGRLQGHEGWSQLFDHTPTLLGLWESLGWTQVMDMAGTEVMRFARASFRFGPLTKGNPYMALTAPGFLPLLALCGLPLYARRKPVMTTVFVLSVVGSVGLICVFYTALVRYFCMLIPLVTLWVAGVVAWGLARDRSTWGGRLVYGSAVATAAAVLALSSTAFVSALRSAQDLNHLTRCAEAVQWIAASTEPDDRVMTFDPWYVAWATDRETVLIPSGGYEPIFTAGWRYKTRWLLAYQAKHRPQTSDLVMHLEGSPNSPPIEKAFELGGCRVYRIDWPAV